MLWSYLLFPVHRKACVHGRESSSSFLSDSQFSCSASLFPFRPCLSPCPVRLSSACIVPSDLLQGNSLLIYSGSYKSWKSWRLRTPVERQPGFPNRFNRRVIDTRDRRELGRGKNLSYSGMTLKPFGRARLQRHPRPVVRSLQGYDGLFGPRPSDPIHLSEEPTRSVIAYPDEDRISCRNSDSPYLLTRECLPDHPPSPF